MASVNLTENRSNDSRGRWWCRECSRTLASSPLLPTNTVAPPRLARLRKSGKIFKEFIINLTDHICSIFVKKVLLYWLLFLKKMHAAVILTGNVQLKEKGQLFVNTYDKNFCCFSKDTFVLLTLMKTVVAQCWVLWHWRRTYLQVYPVKLSINLRDFGEISDFKFTATVKIFSFATSLRGTSQLCSAFTAVWWFRTCTYLCSQCSLICRLVTWKQMLYILGGLSLQN